MEIENLSPVLFGAVESLMQGAALVSSVSDTHYTRVCNPYVSSSMGEHVRHILDMFHAFEAGVAGDRMDYDFRRRGDRVEFERQKALAEFQYFINLLHELAERDLKTAILVKTEVSLSENQSVNVASTVERELVFIASHAVHHFALIGVIARLQNVNLASQIGVAPATASYRRSKETCAQ